MTSPSDLDSGPLAWVKGEIDLALERAEEALKAAVDAPDRGARLQFAQTHLHQVRGALAIVGLEGLTVFSDGLDRLLAELAREERPYSPEISALCLRCVAALGNYLDELSHGVPDRALRLLPLLREIATARGVAEPAAAELFFPDLGARLPRRDAPLPADAADQLRQQLKHLRARYQAGLLSLIKHADSADGPHAMADVASAIENLEALPSNRAFWWSVHALFDSMAEGALRGDPAARQICSRVDAHLRKMATGPVSAPLQLHREVLYRLAVSPVVSAAGAQVRTLYRLDQLIPEAGSALCEQPLGPLLAQLRTRFAEARDTWDRFAGGLAVALPQFEEELARTIEAGGALGRPAFRRLLGKLSEVVSWLRQDPLRFDEALALEVASAIMLAETALDTGRVPDTAFASQVAQCEARLEALTGQTDVQDLATGDLPDAVLQAQERMALSQLSREMQVNLAQVEQTLDDFFRRPERRGALPALQTPLKQIEGALNLLGESRAVEVVKDCAGRIAVLAEGATESETDDYEYLAHHLSALGFFIGELQRGQADLDRLLNPDQPAADIDDTAAPREALPVAGEAVEIAEAPASLPQPEPPGITIPPDDFTDRAELEPMESVAAEAVSPPPTAAPLQAPPSEDLLTASDSEIDSELLDIFIEESHEVLDSIARHLELSRGNPANSETLTTIRRGFHTLKGSGRMVGLLALGDAAWGLEQTLNRWLQMEWEPTEALHKLIGDAHGLFAAWVSQLESGGPLEMNAAALLEEASRLRDSESPLQTPHESSPQQEAEVGDGGELDDALVETDLEFSARALSAADEDPAEEGTSDAASIETDIDFVDLERSQWTEDIADLEEAEDAPEAQATEAQATEPAPTDAGDAFAPPPPVDSFDLDAFGNEDERFDLDLDFAPPAETQAPMDAEVEILEIFDLDEAPVSPPDNGDQDMPSDGAAAATAVEMELPGEAPPAEPEPRPDPDTVQLGDQTLSRPLLDLYLAEARQHLGTLRVEIDRLRTNPVLLPAEPSIRAAHTLSGISGTARINALQTLAKSLEQAQLRLRDAECPPTGEQAELMYRATTTLDAMLAEVAELVMPLPVPELAEQLDTLQRLPVYGEPTLPDEDHEALVPPSMATDSSTQTAIDKPAPASPVLHDELDDQLLPIFLEEGSELLTQLYGCLREWRSDPADDTHHTDLARLLHTLKGSARMAGAMTLGEAVHAIETRLETNRTQVDGTFIDELEETIDAVSRSLDLLSGGGTAEAAEASDETATAAAPMGEAADNETIASTGGTLRVRAELLDQFVNQAGEIGIARTRIEGEMRTVRRSLLDLTENVIRLRNQLREVEIQAESQMQSRISLSGGRDGDFDPLEMDRYTRLQELTRMMAESVNDVTTVQHNLLRNLEGSEAAMNAQSRLNRDLQQGLMRIRMVPFDSIAERLHRVVRQSAKDLGKRATLDIRSGNIEVDRSVLERMTAPLEHLLRNAIAHGIETGEQRRRAGKAEIGQIAMNLAQEGNEIVVELADDGAGLNLERIRERALESGLISADDMVDEKRLTGLIFLPGFSTAHTLSAVSGRGVGMDVVKSETAAVGGRIDVITTPGSGTRFRIYLPVNLAVTQALLVRAAGRSYAIPSSMVAQVQELRPEGLEALRSTGHTDWLGERYSYRYLPRLLGDRETRPEIHKFNWVLLLRAGAQTLALHVDALRGNQEVVIKNAGPHIARIVGISGATVLGDGEIVLILNPVALASRSDIEAADDGPELPAVAVAPEHQPTVMVVDDSLTVRKITGRLLEREGYRVVTAKDGVDALERLLETVPDVVLSDIEMPRMDGFDLARNIRADERLARLPIIMITSRLADKHRQYASEIGVDHYLGKPYQEEELLALIRGYAPLPSHG
ncbi:MAG: Hpt domain-containing protein [Rhodocyclaceae bacterium]|nr:Hpt domain-containing protein [Rhodocyclaceae bacterium]